MTKSDQVEARLLLTGLYAGVVMHAFIVNSGASSGAHITMETGALADQAIDVAKQMANKVLERLGLEDES